MSWFEENTDAFQAAAFNLMKVAILRNHKSGPKNKKDRAG